MGRAIHVLLQGTILEST